MGASRCCGFPGCRAQALGHMGFISCSSQAAPYTSLGWKLHPKLHQLQEHTLSSCGTWTLLLCSKWDLPRPGIKPMSPALAAGFFTTEPPGIQFYKLNLMCGRKSSLHLKDLLSFMGSDLAPWDSSQSLKQISQWNQTITLCFWKNFSVECGNISDCPHSIRPNMGQLYTGMLSLIMFIS